MYSTVNRNVLYRNRKLLPFASNWSKIPTVNGGILNNDNGYIFWNYKDDINCRLCRPGRYIYPLLIYQCRKIPSACPKSCESVRSCSRQSVWRIRQFATTTTFRRIPPPLRHHCLRLRRLHRLLLVRTYQRLRPQRRCLRSPMPVGAGCGLLSSLEHTQSRRNLIY